MKKALISVGTRPNIIKITQFKRLATEHGVEVKILHTGQHYDQKMAQVFYEQFDVEPDFRQELRPGSVLEQITQIMRNVAEVISSYQPDVLLTPGDVNSTFAAAYAAYHAGVPVGHIESGLRSFDRTMPEEVNRVLTDEITDHYFITEKSGYENLKRLGKQDSALHFVGNTMIDTLVHFDVQIERSDIMHRLKLKDDFVLMTFHRPSNVDDREGLEKMEQLIRYTADFAAVVFPIHPRTRKHMAENRVSLLDFDPDRVKIIDPLDYFAFQKLIKNAKFVITDSGGIQEETTFRQVPCLTIRPNTERPVTVDQGTNILLDFDTRKVKEVIDQIQSGTYKPGGIPELWDGRSTERILKVIATA